MTASRTSKLIRSALIVLPLSLGVAGCETFEKLNPFAEQQTPLPGARKPVFPEGVPGVEYGAPPQQPSNSNIPIAPAVRGEEQPPAQPAQTQAARPQPAQTRPQVPQQPAAQQSAKSSKSKGDSDDAWAGAR
jgi:hypothetical protein